MEAQQSHLDCLGLGVAASIKEDGEVSQMDELQASLQACLLSALPRHACCNEDGTRVMLYQLNASLLHTLFASLVTTMSCCTKLCKMGLLIHACCSKHGSFSDRLFSCY